MKSREFAKGCVRGILASRRTALTARHVGQTHRNTAHIQQVDTCKAAAGMSALTCLCVVCVQAHLVPHRLAALLSRIPCTPAAASQLIANIHPLQLWGFPCAHNGEYVSPSGSLERIHPTLIRAPCQPALSWLLSWAAQQGRLDVLSWALCIDTETVLTPREGSAVPVATFPAHYTFPEALLPLDNTSATSCNTSALHAELYRVHNEVVETLATAALTRAVECRQLLAARLLMEHSMVRTDAHVQCPALNIAPHVHTSLNLFCAGSWGDASVCVFCTCALRRQTSLSLCRPLQSSTMCPVCSSSYGRVPQHSPHSNPQTCAHSGRSCSQALRLASNARVFKPRRRRGRAHRVQSEWVWVCLLT